MHEPTLIQVLSFIARDDRQSALSVLRSAIEGAEIFPRDGIELILTLRQASRATVLEAIARVRTSPPGTYRYAPPVESTIV